MILPDPALKQRIADQMDVILDAISSKKSLSEKQLQDLLGFFMDLSTTVAVSAENNAQSK